MRETYIEEGGGSWDKISPYTPFRIDSNLKGTHKPELLPKLQSFWIQHLAPHVLVPASERGATKISSSEIQWGLHPWSVYVSGNWDILLEGFEHMDSHTSGTRAESVGWEVPKLYLKIKGHWVLSLRHPSILLQLAVSPGKELVFSSFNLFFAAATQGTPLAIPFMGIFLKEMKTLIFKFICTPMATAALFSTCPRHRNN